MEVPGCPGGHKRLNFTWHNVENSLLVLCDIQITLNSMLGNYSKSQIISSPNISMIPQVPGTVPGQTTLSKAALSSPQQQGQAPSL